MIKRENVPFVMIENAILNRDLTPHEIAIYVALCIRSNAKDEAWPSYSKLAQDIGSSRSTAIRTVNKLIEKKLVKRERRDETSNIYTVMLIGGSVTETPPSIRETLPSVTETLGVVSERNPNNNHINKNKEQYTVGFLDFWTEYPRKIEKKVAFKAWKAAIKKPLFGDFLAEYKPDYYLIRAAQLYAKETSGREDKHIKHPSSFLNSEYWLELLEKAGINEGIGDDGAADGGAKTRKRGGGNTHPRRKDGGLGPVRCTHGTAAADETRGGRWRLPKVR